MTLMFNPVEFIHQSEKEGLLRGAPEAIALGIDQGRSEQATGGDLENFRRLAERILRNSRRRPGTTFRASPQSLISKSSRPSLSLERSIARQTTQFGIMLGAGLGITVAAIGVIVSIVH